VAKEVAQLDAEKAGGRRLELASASWEDITTSSAEEPPATRAPALEGAARRGGLMVLTGTVELAVDDVTAAVAAVRALVLAAGGSVTTDSLSTQQGASRGRMIVRLPPAKVDPVLEALAQVGRIESRRIDAADVSREYFDQELAIKNLELTMARLQALLERQAGSLKDVVEIERELTRVRGELERLKGSHRYLRDRIALATLQIDLAGRALLPASQSEAKFRLLPHGSVLYLNADGLAPRSRWGGGLTLLPSRLASIELDLYQAPEGRDSGFLLTLGTGLHSDFLGGGQRRFLNPYVGLRGGGGALDGHGALAVAGELGLELYRGRYLTVECAGRALALFFTGDGPPGTVGALQATAGIAFPF